MYMCVYIYVCIYMCVCVCVYICICVYIYIYIYICVCVCIYIYICLYIYVCVYIYIYMFVCVYIYIYIYTYTHTHMYSIYNVFFSFFSGILHHEWGNNEAMANSSSSQHVTFHWQIARYSTQFHNRPPHPPTPLHSLLCKSIFTYFWKCLYTRNYSRFPRCASPAKLGLKLDVNVFFLDNILGFSKKWPTLYIFLRNLIVGCGSWLMMQNKED